MNICIPVNQDNGLESPVCAHFGSAPVFLIIDTEDETCRAIPNNNAQHAHGMCQPLSSIQGEDIGGIVVGGIGMGALTKLKAAGIDVFLAQHPSVTETLAAFKAGTLKPVTPGTACGHHGGQGHGHGGQCAHGGQGRRRP